MILVDYCRSFHQEKKGSSISADFKAFFFAPLKGLMQESIISDTDLI